MRKRKSGLVTVRAISGTHVVFLGFDMAKTDASGLMGFAIQRRDLEEDEVTWLRGNKRFASVSSASANEDASSREHPFQTFQWADYTAKPGYRYEYRVVPMFGKPGALAQGASTTVAIRTEVAAGPKHSVYFNRGAIASQAYSKRFGPVPPEQAGPSAFEWLARDLLPGMLAFIARAKDSDHGLRGAIYETLFDPVLRAFRAAHLSGASVRLLYGGKPGDEITKNEEHLGAAKIASLSDPRTRAKIAHNKFVVLTRKTKPVAVWTGSTNLSENAIYGQLNVGHVIEDAGIAAKYLAYWRELSGDPEPDAIKDWIEANDVIPPPDDDEALVEVFSPHRGKGVFDWYRGIGEGAKKALFMTFPFGIVADFRPVYDHADGVLRYALLEMYVNGGNATSRQKAIDDTQRIRGLPNVGMALGSRIFVDSVDGWMRESEGLGTFVNWVHTKFMLVDPLGSKPITITGSANWSVPSTNENDENMVVIRGDRRVADIYFTEFMRVFAHHRFRESVKRHLDKHGSMAGWRPQDLKEKSSEWLPANYATGGEYEIRRRYFAG